MKSPAHKKDECGHTRDGRGAGSRTRKVRLDTGPGRDRAYSRNCGAAALVAAVLGLTAACGTSPPSRFFTLATAPPAAVTPAETRSISIVVAPVSVPELVDRPQFVLRTAPTRVEIAEQARWAAPLKSEIPRAIAAQLARFLPGARVTTSSQRASDIPDARLVVDIQRFDSTLNESAVIEAAWTVRLRDGRTIGGHSLANEAAGAGYDELVAAHSRALGVISRDIAAAIAAAFK